MPRRKAKKKLKIRARHTGRIEQRGSRFYARWMENGVRRVESTGIHLADFDGDAGKARQAAEAWLARRLAPLRARDAIVKAERDETAVRAQLEGIYKGELAKIEDRRRSDEADGVPPVAVAEAFSRLMSSPKYEQPSPGTALQLKGQITRFTDWLAERHPSVQLLREVTPAVAGEYAAQLKRDVAGGTFNNHLLAIRLLWKVLASEIKGGECPFAEIAKATPEKSTRRPLTDAELKAVFDGARGDRDLTMLLSLMLYTGARLSDACLMRWESIDFNRGIVGFTAIKTGARCRPPLMPELRALLETVPQSERTGYVCPAFAETYKPHPARMSIMIMRHFKACGIETTVRDKAGRSHPVLGAHSFRHTFVSKCGAAGVPLAVVQTWTGHMSASMTERYFHESDAATLMYARAIPAVAAIAPADAPQALPSAGGATTPSDGPDAAESRRDALRAVLDAMGGDELRWARKEIDNRIDAQRRRAAK